MKKRHRKTRRGTVLFTTVSVMALLIIFLMGTLVLASASNAIIIGFNVRPDAVAEENAKAKAEAENLSTENIEVKKEEVKKEEVKKKEVKKK